jgi:6-phospho-beta-glucosidase
LRRLALLGGSSAFTPALAAALCARSRELPELEISVHGRDAERCTLVARFCDRLARARNAAHQYRATTEAGEALQSADLVVDQVRPGGFAGRTHDERFPLSCGLPGDETIGPGGLASAVRGAPLVRALAETSLRVAPRAWFLQMSNPMSILLATLSDLDGLHAFGLCELPGDTLAQALRLVGVERAALEPEVEVDYAGLNHQGFFHRIARDGRDLLPAIFDAVEALPRGHFFRLDAGTMRSLGALPLPYLELHFARASAADRLRARTQSRGAELARLSARLYEVYASSAGDELPRELAARPTRWYDQALVPAIVALCGGAEAELYVSEPNHGHLPELPHDAIVEKRARVDASGVHARPLRTRPPAPLVEHLLAFQRFEGLAARCALDPSPEAVLEALLALPFGLDAAQARALVPDVLASVEVTSKTEVGL